MSDTSGSGGRWASDPSGRFEQRYWDGQKWTEHVSTGGQQSIDPPTAPPPPPSPPQPQPIPQPTPPSSFQPPVPPSGAIVPPFPPQPPMYQAAPGYAPAGYGVGGPAEAPPEGPPIVGYTKRVFSKYATFSGRASRAEYWWFFLANFIVLILLSALSNASDIFGVVYLVWALGTFIPSLAVAIRRLHDTDKSGWFLLISLIPLVGTIILIVFLATRGNPGPNRYGTPPS